MHQDPGRPFLYLASPLGFAASTLAFLEELVARLDALGFEVLNPWTLPTTTAAVQDLTDAMAIPDTVTRRKRLKDASMRIAAGNEEAIRQSDLVVAVLDGTDVDSGTAAEIGFAAALGRPVFGLRTDFRPAGDNEGVVVNLQVQWWIEQHGGSVTRTLDELADALSTVRTPPGRP
jgi:nucleoside 2-deoxyribosyltransferase